MKDLNKEKFHYDFRTQEYFYIINSEEFDEDLVYIINEGIKNIIVASESYKWTGVEALLLIPNLKRLFIAVGAFDMLDLKKLNGISDLDLGEKIPRINLSGLTSLNYLSFQYPRKNVFLGMPDLINLNELLIRECRDLQFNWVTNFANFRNLEKLELTLCYLPEDISFVKSLLELRELEIHYNPKPFRLKNLMYCRKLEKLILAQCPQFQNKEDIPLLQSVKWLRLTDCGTVEDCSIFYDMPNLEVLIITGKTYFVNGDLSGMMGRLKHFGFDNKRHYNLKAEDFPSIFKK